VLKSFPVLNTGWNLSGEINGVRYFNDSKGTNVGAVVKSLASFNAPVILLAGGVDKGGDYSP
jgi:UDP-N-acetylmuramoylalanine--D-glutamate ligase